MPWIFALPLLLLASLPDWAPALAAESPRITTESIEYCEELAARLAASPRPVAALLRELGEEGQRLCTSGHVRAGIAKLRRALRAARPEARGE